MKPKGSNSFISVETLKRKQPEEAKTCQEAIARVDVNKHLSKVGRITNTPAHTVTSTDVTASMHENMQYNILNYHEQSNICAHMVMSTNETINMHENMQYNIIDNGTKLIDSDEPYRPDSLLTLIDSEKPHRPDSLLNDSDKSYRPVSPLTRVEVQNVQQDTASVRKVPVTIPDVVDSEDVTLQDGCAKVSSKHSGYWKSVVSFGTASADLIVPVDDENINRHTSRSNKRGRTRQKRIYKNKQKDKFKSHEQIPAESINITKAHFIRDRCVPVEACPR